MKQITVTVLPQQTGKGNYMDPEKCPIAAALKNEGYYQIYVWAAQWKARKSGGFFTSRIFTGTIPHETRAKALEISLKKQKQAVLLTLNINPS